MAGHPAAPGRGPALPCPAHSVLRVMESGARAQVQPLWTWPGCDPRACGRPGGLAPCTMDVSSLLCPAWPGPLYQATLEVLPFELPHGGQESL